MPISSERLQEARVEKGWSQNAMAYRLSNVMDRERPVNPQAVCRWETGKAVPDADTIEAIARVTGKPIEFFYA